MKSFGVFLEICTQKSDVNPMLSVDAAVTVLVGV
jgi:hypothetical protein